MWQSVVSSGKEERFAFERQGSRVVESLESRECVVFLRYSTGARRLIQWRPVLAFPF